MNPDQQEGLFLALEVFDEFIPGLNDRDTEARQRLLARVETAKITMETNGRSADVRAAIDAVWAHLNRV